MNKFSSTPPNSHNGIGSSKEIIRNLEGCISANDDFLFTSKLIQSLLALSDEIKEIKACLHSIEQSRVDKFKECWVDGQDVMLSLNISPRTLQTLRDRNTLPYSRISGKFYYKISDLEALLQSTYSGKR